MTPLRRATIWMLASCVPAFASLHPVQATQQRFGPTDAAITLRDRRGNLEIRPSLEGRCQDRVCQYDFLFDDHLVATSRFLNEFSIRTTKRKPGLFLIRAEDPDFSGTIVISVGSPQQPGNCRPEEHQGELLTRKGFAVEARRTEHVIKALGCVSVSTNIQTR
ncbi:MAG: hypothetical protein PGN34_21405 [Methylobacterium frigidaeris]